VKLVTRGSKGVTHVEFFEDGALLGVDVSAPFETQISLTKAEQTTHQFTVKAFVATGNSVSSEVADLEVKIAGRVWFVSKSGLDGKTV
jgi:hypothetical protein